MAKKSRKSSKKSTKRPARKSVQKSAKTSAAKKAAPKRKAAKPAPPKGHALVSVTPGFTANDAEASIKWYCDVLGFAVKERWERDGQFLGAQIGSGAVTINIGQDDWRLGRDRIKGQGSRLYFMIGSGIDQYAEAIKTRGGTLAEEPQDGWGMRWFAINDPDGFKLTFMTAAKK